MDPVKAFLAKHELLTSEDFAQLIGWTDETLKAKMARRETPDFIRVKRLVLFPWGAIRKWIDAEGEHVTAAGANAAAADLMGGRK